MMNLLASTLKNCFELCFIVSSLSSGDCLEMKMRCNTIVDCPFDEGDETNCAKVLLTETYNSDAAPNTGVKINGDYTVNKVI